MVDWADPKVWEASINTLRGFLSLAGKLKAKLQKRTKPEVLQPPADASEDKRLQVERLRDLTEIQQEFLKLHQALMEFVELYDVMIKTLDLFRGLTRANLVQVRRLKAV